VRLIKPLTYMNLSGRVLAPLLRDASFDVARDLLILVDDTALDVGRLRFRASGSSGGHNGLKSIESVLRTQEYARLRIGVGAPAGGTDLADWVLSPFDKEDARLVQSLMPDVIAAAQAWLDEGADTISSRFNK
jgi:PTH1 family peptidyl-tRNA hydrolase